MSDRASAYRDPVLHFDALRLVALREGERIEETPRNSATENEQKILYAHLRTYTQPKHLFAAGESLQPTLRTGLMAPCLASCSVYLVSNSWILCLTYNQRAQ